MKYFKLFLVLAVFVAALAGFLGKASADQQYAWEFTVPVNVKELPKEVKQVRVWVDISGNGWGIGAGQVYDVPPDGTVNQTAVIKMINPSDKHSTPADKYRVALHLSPVTDQTIWFGPNTPDKIFTRAKSGTELVDVIEGDLSFVETIVAEIPQKIVMKKK